MRVLVALPPPQLLVLSIHFCYSEEQYLTGWICLLYFHLCVPWFLFTYNIHNGLTQGTLPFRLNVKPKCFCSEPCFWMATGRKKLIYPLPKACHSRRQLKDSWSFCFLTSSPSLFYKITWHPDPNKMVILRHYSAIFWVSWVSKQSCSCILLWFDVTFHYD